MVPPASLEHRILFDPTNLPGSCSASCASASWARHRPRAPSTGPGPSGGRRQHPVGPGRQETGVFTALALVIGEIISFLSFYIRRGFPVRFGSAGHPRPARRAPSRDRRWVLYSRPRPVRLGLATIIRTLREPSPPSLLLILPLISQALPSSINDVVARYLPATSGGHDDRAQRVPIGRTHVHTVDRRVVWCTCAVLLVGGWLDVAAGCLHLPSADLVC